MEQNIFYTLLAFLVWRVSKETLSLMTSREGIGHVIDAWQMSAAVSGMDRIMTSWNGTQSVATTQLASN